MSEPSIRSIVDAITLDVAEVAEGERSPEKLQEAIAGRAIAHIRHLIDDGTLVDDPDIDRVTEAIVRGVLDRLGQIAEGGGQIGSA